MKKSLVLVVIVGLFLTGFVSSFEIFSEDFEDGQDNPWVNWESTGPQFSKWYIQDLFLEGEGNGDYSAKSLWGNALSSLTQKDPMDLSLTGGCQVSFYSGSDCGGNCPQVTFNFYNGSSWFELMEIDYTDSTSLAYYEVDIDNAYLNESSKIRFDSSGVGNVYLDDIVLDCSATPDMNIELGGVECGEYFMVGDNSTITIIAEDSDDYLTGNVSIDDQIFEFTNGGVEFNYTWNRAGNVRIDVYAINTERYQKKTGTSVMVIDPTVSGEYLAACIDEPAHFSDLSSSNVFFNASSTRGIINESGALRVINKSDLLFTWEFSDGLPNFNTDPEVTDLAWTFYKNYITSGNNWASLNVEFKSGI